MNDRCKIGPIALVRLTGREARDVCDQDSCWVNAVTMGADGLSWESVEQALVEHAVMGLGLDAGKIAAHAAALAQEDPDAPHVV